MSFPEAAASAWLDWANGWIVFALHDVRSVRAARLGVYMRFESWSTDHMRLPADAIASLYPRLMGDAWLRLDDSVRAAHLSERDQLCAAGCFEVRHGRSRLVTPVLRLLGLPREAAAIPVRLATTREGNGEEWRRMFADDEMVTFQEELPGGVLGERLGPVELQFRLEVDRGALVYRQVGARLRLGPLSIPLLRRFSPQVSAREESAGGAHRTRVMVEVTFPVVGMVIRYGGELEWEAAE